MGERDRNQDRDRQHPQDPKLVPPPAKLEGKERMTSRTKCLCHEDAKALAL